MELVTSSTTPILPGMPSGDDSPPAEHFPDSRPHARVEVLGLPVSVLTFDETLQELDRRIASGQPGFWITANLNYAMLTAGDACLRRVNDKAVAVLADGMPLVWASRLSRTPLPSRVTGSDLTPAICRHAAERGYRVFLLGAAQGVARRAAKTLTAWLPGLQIVGCESPPFRQLSEAENRELVTRIRMARPDILLVAFGQPKGELWLADHMEALQVPVGIQIGASLDFIAGDIKRAPRWMQRTGLEWAYRVFLEPRRLARRYFANAVFLAKTVLRKTWNRTCRDHNSPDRWSWPKENRCQERFVSRRSCGGGVAAT